MRDRLQAAAEHVRTADQLYRAAIRSRNELIFEAIDRVGLSHRDCARAAGITCPRLEAILAGG